MVSRSRLRSGGCEITEENWVFLAILQNIGTKVRAHNWLEDRSRQDCHIERLRKHEGDDNQRGLRRTTRWSCLRP